MLSSVFHLKKTKTKGKAKQVWMRKPTWGMSLTLQTCDVMYIIDVWCLRAAVKASSLGPKESAMTSSTLMSLGLWNMGFYLLMFMYVCMYVFGRRKCRTMARVWKSEDSLWESVFSFYHMGSGMLLGPWSLVVNAISHLSYLVVFFTCEWWCSFALTGIFSVARQFSRKDLSSLTLRADLWHAELVSNKIENP